MAKKQKLDEFIINILKEGPLSRKKIITRIKASSEYENAPKSPMSYNEAFNKLLQLNIIQFEGYELPKDWDPEKTNAKRMQSMNTDNLIFSLVKTEFLDIFNLIKQLNNDDHKKAYKELKYLFKKKMQEIEVKNQNKWYSLVNNVVVRKLRDEELLQLKGETESNAFLIAQASIFDETELEIYGVLEKLEEYDEKLPNIREEYKNASVYYLKNLKNQKEDISSSIKRVVDKVICLDPDENPIRFIETYKEYEDVYYKKEILLEGDVDKENYLKSLGYIKPKKLDDKAIDLLFEDVIFYVYSQDPIIPAMQKLSRALSDQEQSKKFLEEIVALATGKE